MNIQIVNKGAAFTGTFVLSAALISAYSNDWVLASLMGILSFSFFLEAIGKIK